MKTKFNDFLNEYGGPGKATGFRYSNPTLEYKFSVGLVINPILELNDVTKSIQELLDENHVEEDVMKMEHLMGDVYLLIIELKAYSKFEIDSMLNVVLDEIVDMFGEDIEILVETIMIVGDDIKHGDEKAFKPTWRKAKSTDDEKIKDWSK